MSNPDSTLKLDYDEIGLLLEALEHYEKEGLPDEMLRGLFGGVLRSLVETKGNQTKTEDIGRKLAQELEQKQQTKKEMVVLLRAKLIRMKDQALANSFSQGETNEPTY